MSDLIKVENDTLARDLNTSAILETDISKLKKYRSFKRSMKQKEQKIDMLLERINNLENLIGRMLNNGNNNTEKH
jgi:DNA-binding sugar fermentation-stimulating protein